MNLNPNQLIDYANTFVTVLVDYSQKIISAFVILFIIFTPSAYNRFIRKTKKEI
jgi:small conductance mechanosensitive channel